MKANEYKKMTSSDLEKELVELKSELFKLRFQNATNGLDNPMKIKTTKKNIARVKTVLREKELEEAE
ncbi:MAG: 50S ribosomal protein L29 [Clostridia bacterium]|nr:50S ribosomal protein L29 [Clostridia bacterium]